MEISNSQLNSAFTLAVNSTQQDSARTPVIIDSQPVFELEQQNQSLPVLSAATKQQEITTNDSRQAQFVRLFATQAEPSSTENSALTTFQAQILPKGVQQYLQVSQLVTLPGQRFDETV